MPNLSLREKIGQLFVIGFYGEELSAEVEAFIEKNNIGFVILFSRNISSIAQAAALNNHIHSLGKITPAVYTDQEGGLVVRFGEEAATVISAMGLAATGDPGNARRAGRIIGGEMSAIGIDGVFAPVLDVNIEAGNPVIGIRAFSDDPGIVVTYARQFAAGLNEGGVAACGKHFPGHGGTTLDSHLEIPTASLSRADFFRYWYAPFAELARSNIESLMTAHVRFPNIDDGIATFSSYFTRRLLREETGYRGVLFSDCLEMNAVKDNFTPAQVVEFCMAGGIDVLCPSHTLAYQEELLQYLLFAVEKGLIPEQRVDESLARILTLKQEFSSIPAEDAAVPSGKKVNKKFFAPRRGEASRGAAGADRVAATHPRRQVDPQQAEKSARGSIAGEREIAAKSITLLRNRLGIIPIEKEKKVLLVEWQVGRATTDFSGKKAVSLLAEIARSYLPNADTEVLKTGADFLVHLEAQLAEYDYIVACPYSLNRERELAQAADIRRIIAVRPDVIAASTGNPYDILHFPEIDTYLVSYGARQVQLEALFRVITGEIEPVGRLPVEIAGIFPRSG